MISSGPARGLKSWKQCVVRLSYDRRGKILLRPCCVWTSEEGYTLLFEIPFSISDPSGVMSGYPWFFIALAMNCYYRLIHRKIIIKLRLKCLSYFISKVVILLAWIVVSMFTTPKLLRLSITWINFFYYFDRPFIGHFAD